MTMKSRLERLERKSPSSAEPALTIIIRSFKAPDQENSHPSFAYIMAGPHKGSQAQQFPEESDTEFEERLHRIVAGECEPNGRAMTPSAEE